MSAARIILAVALHLMNSAVQTPEDCFVLFFVEFFGSRRHLTTFGILCNDKIYAIEKRQIRDKPLTVIQVSKRGLPVDIRLVVSKLSDNILKKHKADRRAPFEDTVSGSEIMS